MYDLDIRDEWLQDMQPKKATPFLTKAQRTLLTDEFVEVMYALDEDYCEDAEITDREWLSKLGNNAFYEAMVDQMPECMLYLD